MRLYYTSDPYHGKDLLPDFIFIPEGAYMVKPSVRLNTEIPKSHSNQVIFMHKTTHKRKFLSRFSDIDCRHQIFLVETYGLNLCFPSTFSAAKFPPSSPTRGLYWKPPPRRGNLLCTLWSLYIMQEIKKKYFYEVVPTQSTLLLASLAFFGISTGIGY